jgi:hypothetical protein
MYIWRYTDNLIRDLGNNQKDSGFVSMKPNGDFNNATSLKEIYSNNQSIWYSDKNIIWDAFCLDHVPHDHTFSRYSIKNDTLFLNISISGNTDFAKVAKTYIHFKKY